MTRLDLPCRIACLAAVGLTAAVAAGEQGERVLERSAKAYREAPALTDAVELEVRTWRGRIRDEMTLAMGEGADSRVVAEGHVFTAVGDTVYMHRPALPGKYYAAPLKRDLVTSLAGVAVLPLPHFGLRHGRTLDDWIDAFNPAPGSEFGLVGHRAVEHEGRTVDELSFGGAETTVTALIDPETGFVLRHEAVLGFNRLTTTMAPTVHERLPEPIAFDTDGRRRVSSPRLLSLGEGDPAPDFMLETLDGRRVRLSDQRGSVVVLDFWATWCGPCRDSLPMLDRFTRWAEDADLPVKVFAVDIGERVPGDEQKRKLVSRYWDAQEFSMPTLMDFDSAVAETFEVGPIPHTVIVAPDGTIVAVQVGGRPDMVAHLQRVVRRALDRAG